MQPKQLRAYWASVKARRAKSKPPKYHPQTDEQRYKSNAKHIKKAHTLDLYKHLHHGQDRQTTKQIKNELYQNPHRTTL